MIDVKIVGAEALSASGLNKNEIFESCLYGRSAINEKGLAPISNTNWQFLSDSIKTSETNLSRCLIASTYCLNEAIQNARWNSTDLIDCGFIFSTTTSQIDKWQNLLPLYFMKNLSNEQISEATRFQSLGLTLVELKKYFNIAGPSTVIASSCSASLQALCIASIWIQTGLIKRCIVGTTEILSDLTINGFNSMRLLTKGISKPFDKTRAGINLGEASAFICLEAGNLSDNKALGFLTGFGLSTDAYHPTAPHPDGAGSVRSMTMALQKAGLNPEDIDWIYAHGTGSTANDLAESKAIKSIYKKDPLKIPAVTSTKSIHGHTLGACGGLELVIALQCLEKNVMLPTFHTSEIDEQIDLDVVLKPREKKLTHILKNSLGFGGINSSIILSSKAVLQ